MIKKFNRDGFLLVIGIMVICFLMAGCSVDQFEKEVLVEKSAVKLTREVVAGNYDVLTTEEFKNRIDEKQELLIIDTMPYESSYKKNHVPGAKQFEFPIPDMAAWDSGLTNGKTQVDYETLLGADKKKTIVIYCGFTKCTRSHNGAVWAKKMGYENVYRYPGGIYAWKGAGFITGKVE